MNDSRPKIQVKPFTMVRRVLWSSKRFTELPNDATRYLYQYFLTGPHQTASGCFVAKEAYVLADLDLPGSDFTARTYAERKQLLVDSGLILADEATGETLVTRWWKDQGPSNPSWYKGAQKQCGAIRSADLQKIAHASLDEAWAAFQASVTNPTVASVKLSENSARLVGTLAQRGGYE